jgi:pimeloyl-ACP methyl ester carboxylesterase
MSAMGEGKTITRHPELIERLVEAGRNRTASATNLAELRAVITPAGFRPSARLRLEELGGLTAPALVIWGDHDPVGPLAAARETVAAIPAATLHVMSAGHVPYLADPAQVGDLVSEFAQARAVVSPG